MWEAQIKAALKAAGMDESLFSRIAVTKEGEIADAVKKLQRDLDSEKVIKVLEDAGLKDVFEKVLQSKVDQIVDKKLKTIDDKKKSDSDVDAAKKKADAEKIDGMSESDKRFQALMDTVEKLTGKIQSIEETSAKVTRETTVKAALKTAGLSEGMAKYITGTDEESITEQITGLKSDMLSLKQSENDKALAEGRTPEAGTAGGTASEATIAAFAKTRTPASAGGGGLAAQQVTKPK